MAHIPEAVYSRDLDRMFEAAGFRLISSGKVRQTYERHPNKYDELLSVATDRLSIFDFVLPVLVPKKGEVLTALTIFWLEEVLRDFPHHLEAHGAVAVSMFPTLVGDYRDLAGRLVVIEKLKILPVECIVRGYLTGSGWRTYQKDGTVCGHKLPGGLHDGSKLTKPLFTPTSKAEVGHDEDMDAKAVRKKYGRELEEMSLEVYCMARDYCFERGIVLADTKFELGDSTLVSQIELADEVLTPDSSRFWDFTEWAVASKEHKSPAGYDKEPVRQWGMTVETPFGVTGLNKLDTENKEHLAFVDALEVPAEVVADTTARYLEIFRRLTGMELEEFQREKMGIN